MKFTKTLKENNQCYATAFQREIILELIRHQILKTDFFLTGGTALAVFYLHHRRSNDLDFFCINSIDFSKIDFNLKAIRKNAYTKIKESPNFLSSLIQNVKVDFVFDPLSFKEDREKYYFSDEHFLLIDTIHNIFSNKFCTIASRIEPKDFIDFYFIQKQFKVKSLQSVYDDARLKDAIFDDPPTVAYQIESGINFLEKNPDILPSLLIDFDIQDFYQFYHDTVNWIYHKIDYF